MNISTGGPHILLFERDQQLTGLLISEFQLAGYECHTARTAVEVFDAIARQPIRLILVNLAQAAAARREFWVALDTQRRGRGVQVLTFHCTNIANYGPKDPDEHIPTMVDLEVDGMMGIMNLVDAIRARVPVGTNNAPENSFQRVLRSTGQTQMSPQRPPLGGNGQLQRNESTAIRNFQTTAGQAGNDQGFGNENQARMQPSNPTILSGTSPTAGYLQSNNATTQQAYTPSMSNSGTNRVTEYPQVNNASAQQAYTPGMNNGNTGQASMYPQRNNGAGNTTTQQAYAPGLNNGNNMSTQTSTQQSSNSMMNPQPGASQGFPNGGNSSSQPAYSEKIRAVLYPNQRTWSPSGTSTPVQENRNQIENSSAMGAPQQTETTNSTLQQLANGQIGRDGQWESGLAQLSRMVQERNNTQFENSSPAYQPPKAPPTQDMPIATPNFEQLFQTNSTTAYMAPPTPQGEPQTENLSMHTLRASPIQDLPTERGGTETNRRPDLFTRTNYAQQAPQPTLASISAAAQGEQEPQQAEKRENSPVNTTTQKNTQETPVAKSRQAEATVPHLENEAAKPIRARIVPEAPAPSRPVQENISPTQGRPFLQENSPYLQNRVAPEPTQPLRNPSEQATPITAHSEQTPFQKNRENTTFVSEEEQDYMEPKQTYGSMNEAPDYTEIEVNKQFLEKAQAEIKVALGQHTSFDPNNTPSNALLLDIMQSLPPMPAPTQQIQPQVLSGRATRSLGSVLLEGHLVPQNRLEVAQNVQRMLRGVDLNYQLGEILLMFKLLTPDQLLAASLVSYGMINPTQITALGRIRQELHAIGLEYDLENLLIMFRILTTDQLREVRASW